MLGYRTLKVQLTKMYGMCINEKVVRQKAKEICPDRLEFMHNQQLVRRHFGCPGCNHCFGLDGNDKHIRFGLCYHAGIDCFSNRLMWVHVGTTNKNPVVPLLCYLETVSEIGGTPTYLRSDYGRENAMICPAHIYLRDGNESAYIYGN